MRQFEQVVVKLNERWYQGEEGDILVIARDQAELIDCEILNTWENWKRAILTKKEEKEMVEAPKVPKIHCPKEDRMVPIWWCLGSFVQQRYPCPELLEATVKIAEDYAEVKCKAQKLNLGTRGCV